MPFPPGAISVDRQSTRDETNGRNWHMPAAQNVRFLAVSGQIWIGDTPLWYDFTLIEYHVYIDEVSWLIFSVLGGASETEFEPHFWKTLNQNRKDTWEFQKVAWSTSKNKYDVSRPYEDFVLPIFDTFGNTLRTQQPFANQWTHVRVHQHAAAVFAEEKKICFMLPLIVQNHQLLPTTPVFWKNDDDTIPLYRTTMWLNQQTVEYLASTGEWYPSELRSEIQPRIEACKDRQQPRKQPPDPPKPTRWQAVAHPATHGASPSTGAAEPPNQTPKESQKSPRQEAQKDQQYLLMAKKFAQMIATVPQAADAPTLNVQVSTSTTQQQPTESPKETARTEQQDSVAKDGEKSTVKAQQLTETRPKPPPVPETETATDVQDAPGTGELSSSSGSKVTAQKHDEHSNTPAQGEPSGGDEEKPQAEASPTSSPTESSETMKTSPAGNHPSEELHASESPTAVDEADLPTLKSMRKETKNKLAVLATEMYHLQGHLDCLNKRIKTVQSDKGKASTSTSPTPDIEMEVVD